MQASPNSIILIFLFVGAAISVSPVLPPYTNPDAAPNLSIVIPGIRANADVESIGRGNVLHSSGNRYVIVNNEADIEKVSLSVPRENIVVFDVGNTDSYHKLAEIGRMPNASVVIDMDLKLKDLSLFKRKWDKQTDWASFAAALVAQAHHLEFAEGKVLLYGHSAGTEAVAKALKLENDWRKNGEVKEDIFTRCIVSSARDLSNFPKNDKTTMIIADGDFGATPGGNVGLGTVFKPFREKDAIRLSREGYNVIRITSTPFWLVPHGVGYWEHLEVNNFFSGATIRFYPAGTGNPSFLQYDAKTLGEAIQESLIFDAYQSNSSSSETLEESLMDFMESQPTDGLGGISLSTIANMPVNREAVHSAGFDHRRTAVFLLLKNGDTLWFPRFDAEVVRLAYESAYSRDKKPELSIGSSPFRKNGVEDKKIQPPPGKMAVYYLGETEGTWLGLVMYLADKCLSKLTFGPTAAVNEISQAVPGFHSMPELFPAKYTHTPASQKYLELDSRVFLNTDRVDIVFNEKEQRLDFENINFELHFSNHGPAEDYYAKFFTSHFHEIANTEQGNPLKRLTPFAGVVSVFRWLKKNAIDFDAHELLNVPITKVYTPRFTDPPPSIQLSEISPCYPTVLFGPFGPTDIFYSASKQTTISYMKGLPVKIVCPNQKTMEIFRDGLGVPVSWKTSDGFAEAFCIHASLGPLLYTNVHLQGHSGTSVLLDGNAQVYPENQPEVIVQQAISKFIDLNTPK